MQAGPACLPVAVALYVTDSESFVGADGVSDPGCSRIRNVVLPQVELQERVVLLQRLRYGARPLVTDETCVQAQRLQRAVLRHALSKRHSADVSDSVGAHVKRSQLRMTGQDSCYCACSRRTNRRAAQVKDFDSLEWTFEELSQSERSCISQVLVREFDCARRRMCFRKVLQQLLPRRPCWISLVFVVLYHQHLVVAHGSHVHGDATPL
mmetsp:Transcript_44964/g.141546  ORF Transcript_44964/g.141546 Transcript_44964/m.141546 type:complete len:209 (-) Transcript_44964:15-641(-)